MLINLLVIKKPNYYIYEISYILGNILIRKRLNGQIGCDVLIFIIISQPFLTILAYNHVFNCTFIDLRCSQSNCEMLDILFISQPALMSVTS